MCSARSPVHSIFLALVVLPLLASSAAAQPFGFGYEAATAIALVDDPTALQAVDIDGGGDTDLVLVLVDSGEVLWLENQQTTWIKALLYQS